MKKLLILLALLSAAALAACTANDHPPTATDAASATTGADTTVEITKEVTEEITDPAEITEPATTAVEETTAAPETTAEVEETTTEEETVPMIEVTPEAIVDARLTVDAYRGALTEALTAANLNYAITSDGSDTGFDAVVVNTMDRKSYAVNVTDTAILVRAGHYLSLESAFKEILAGKGLDGRSFAGEYSGDVPLSMDEMVLVWNEEFTGNALDPAKWTLKAKMNQGDILNSTDEKNILVADGVLLLRSWKEEEGAE